jgi:hypothetical protein
LCQQSGGGLRHQLAKGGNAAAMECWLHETAMLQPGWAIGGCQPLAKKGLRSLIQEEIAVVVLVIALQDVLDAIRVKDEVTGPEEQAGAHDVPIALGLLREETEGIMLKSQRTSQQQVPAWSRRSRAVP